jgi:5-methylcytosine-specific restriction enzyme A
MRRTAPLPKDWASIRRGVLRRDAHRCTAILADGTRCKERATEVHHLGSPSDHRPEMLTAICEWHHKKETARQANANKKRITQRRQAEPHPGIRT